MIKKPAHATVFFIPKNTPSEKTNKNNWYFLFCVQSESLILVHVQVVHVPIRDRISGRELNPVVSPRLGRAWSLWCPPVRTVRAVSSPHRSPSPRSSSSQTKQSHLAKPNIVSFPNQTLYPIQTKHTHYAAICTASKLWQIFKYGFFDKICEMFCFWEYAFKSLQGITSKEIENFLLLKD